VTSKEQSDDEALVRRAEEALSQIDREHGLADHHAEVLAALRIRVFGAPKQTLDDAFRAAGRLKGKKALSDVEVPQREGESLEDVIKKPERKKGSLEDLLEQ
jgi:hypothetical protein